MSPKTKEKNARVLRNKERTYESKVKEKNLQILRKELEGRITQMGKYVFAYMRKQLR